MVCEGMRRGEVRFCHSQGAKQCYLVGDPNQLPATVISRKAKNLG